MGWSVHEQTLDSLRRELENMNDCAIRHKPSRTMRKRAVRLERLIEVIHATGLVELAPVWDRIKNAEMDALLTALETREQSLVEKLVCGVCGTKRTGCHSGYCQGR